MRAAAQSGASESHQPSATVAEAADMEPSAGTELLESSEVARPATDGGFGWIRKRWVLAAASVVVFLLLLLAYAAQARTLAATSESSAQALQAWDMLHGNVLLRGWTLSDVTFYTTELPQYMLVEVARGLSGVVVHVAAGLTYALLFVLVALLAAGRATGRDRLVSVLAAAAIMLAPTVRPGTYLLLSAPDHLGTQAPLLLAWLVLDRARARWWAPVAIGGLLALAQVADVLVLYEGVVPLVVVCAIRMYRQRGPLSGQAYELSLLGAALASVAVARLALALIHHAGGFTARSLRPHRGRAPDRTGPGRMGRGCCRPPVLPGERLRGPGGLGRHRRHPGRIPVLEQGSRQRDRMLAPARRGPGRARARRPAPARRPCSRAGGGACLLRRPAGVRRDTPARSQRRPAGRKLARSPSPDLRPGGLLGSGQRHCGKREPRPGQARPDVPPRARHHPVGDRRVVVRPAAARRALRDLGSGAQLPQRLPVPH